MIDGLRPYPEIKPSGLSWLGDVPVHWDVLRSKYSFREVDSRSATGEETHLSMSQRLGLVPASQVEKSLVSESYLGAKLVEKDDLVLNRLKAHLGVFAYAKQSGLISPDYTVLRPQSRANVRFFEYVLKSPACRAELRTRAKGIVEGFWRLYTDDFYDIRLPIPPLDEQRLIVRFLDWHGEQTAKVVHAKRKIIALLNEQKQAITHRAVTRGLDPDVKLQSSGIRWLDKMPKHWDTRRIGTLFKQRNQTGFPELPILEVSLRTGVRIRQFDASARKQVMADRDKYKRAVKGDIAYNMMRMWQGAVGLVPADGLVSPAYVVAVPLPDVEAAYFTSLFRTPACMGEIDGRSRGIVKDRNRLYWEDFKQIWCPSPPPPEQRAIVDFIENYSATVAGPVTRALQEIELLQEFRTRVIADAVTGKLDVRDFAKSLPDMTETETSESLSDDPAESDGLDEIINDAEDEEAAA